MEKELQLPMIHLNGSGAESLFKQYNQAYDAIIKAIDAFNKIDISSRDYYVIDSEAYERARLRKAEERVKLMNVMIYLENHLIHIEKFMDDHPKTITMKDIDFFDRYDLLPPEVNQIITSEKYIDDECYDTCNELISDLEKVGWTCDYGLDAQPYDLFPVTPQAKEQLEKHLKTYGINI